jgi:hypothetical protein
MVKVISSVSINIAELEEQQIELLREALISIKTIRGDSLNDAKKKEAALSALNQVRRLEQEISPNLIKLERAAKDYLPLAREQDTSKRILTSLPFLNKYTISEWLDKIIKHFNEGNNALIVRTIEEDLLDQHFGMLSGRYEHTKYVEQHLPEEERNEGLAYNASLGEIQKNLEQVKSKAETAQFKDGTDKEKLGWGIDNTSKALFGKGFLWKSGLIPDIESYYKADIPELKSSQAITLDDSEITSRSNTLLKLETGLKKTSTAAFAMIDACASFSPETVSELKQNLAQAFTLFHIRAFNLIVPLSYRATVKLNVKGLGEHFTGFSAPKPMESQVAISSTLPEFVYEYFQAMEALAKEARQKIADNNYKDAVLNLEEIYIISLKRDWERLKKLKDTKAGDILMERNNEVKETIQKVRNVIRNSDAREKQFTHLILNLEQTNQLLAAKRGE